MASSRMSARSADAGIEVDRQVSQPARMNDYFARPDSPRKRPGNADAIAAGREENSVAAVRSGRDVSTFFARAAERDEDAGSRTQARYARHADGDRRGPQDESGDTARKRRATCPARRNGEDGSGDGENA